MNMMVENVDMHAVQQDEELKLLLLNPKMKEVVEQIKVNPMAAFQYMSDPEVGPILMKMIGKIMPGFGDVVKQMSSGTD